MENFFKAIQNGNFTKTLSINVTKLLENKLIDGLVVNDCGSVFQGHCCTHTLINIEGLTIVFTKRAFIKYRPSMPTASKFVFDYNIDQLNKWEVEKTRCTNALNLNNTDIQKTISYLIDSGVLEYNSKDEDDLLLQISVYHAEENGIDHSGLDADAINDKLMDDIIKSQLFRNMDSFFS